MHTRNRGLLLTTFVVAVLATSSCSAGPSVEQTAAVSADYPAYESVKSLADAADLIVEVSLGEPKADLLLPQYEGDDPAVNPAAGAKETPDPGEGAVPITVFEASVIEVYRGDAAPGDVIKVMQPGGIKDGVDYVVEGVTRLEAGSTVLLFLSSYPDSPAAVLGGDVGAFAPNGEGFVSLGSGLEVTKSDLGSF